jgi:hypothetical protein
VKNPGEAATDCGRDSTDCGVLCRPGDHCNGSIDCEAGCSNDKCAVATHCASGVKDGSETDVDCGGFGCGPCVAGKGCLVNLDCQAGLYCAAGACAATKCTDGSKNGDETDVDCGGACPKCVAGKGCTAGRDCASGVCSAGHCL